MLRKKGNNMSKSGYEIVKERIVKKDEEIQRLKLEMDGLKTQISSYEQATKKLYKVEVKSYYWFNLSYAEANQKMKELIDIGAGEFVSIEKQK